MGCLGDGITDTGLLTPRALPIKRVQAKQEGQTLVDRKIIEPSSDHVSPPYQHFKSCGGFQVQHASDMLMVHCKTEFFIQALAAHGLKTRMNPMLTSPPNSHRRADFYDAACEKG